MKFRDFHYFSFEQVGDLLYNYKNFCTTKSCFYFIQYKLVVTVDLDRFVLCFYFTTLLNLKNLFYKNMRLKNAQNLRKC